MNRPNKADIINNKKTSIEKNNMINLGRSIQLKKRLAKIKYYK